MDEVSQEAERVLGIVADMGFQLLASKEEIKQRLRDNVRGEGQ